MKFNLLIILSLFFVSAVHADSKQEKIKTLMDAVGLTEMFEQQMEMGKQQSHKVAQQALDQIFSQLNPNEEFKERFSDAFNKYMSKVEAPWSAQEVVDVWASYYGPGFTENELDELIDFYTSPLGKKEVRVSREAMVSFSEHFQKAGEPIMQEATSEYIKDLKLIAKQCNCAK